MDKISAFGSKVIVEREKKEDNKGLIMVGDDAYHRGTVVSVGKIVASDLFSDSERRLEPGALVAYPSEKAKSLGLGFPDSYDVVEAEDIVGVIYQDEGNDE